VKREDRRITLIDEPFVAVHPDGQRQSFQIIICSPQPAREKDPWSWSCPISLKPLYRGEMSSRGLLAVPRTRSWRGAGDRPSHRFRSKRREDSGALRQGGRRSVAEVPFPQGER